MYAVADNKFGDDDEKKKEKKEEMPSLDLIEMEWRVLFTTKQFFGDDTKANKTSTGQ